LDQERDAAIVSEELKNQVKEPGKEANQKYKQELEALGEPIYLQG
jgi:hypothetical protein